MSHECPYELYTLKNDEEYQHLCLALRSGAYGVLFRPRNTNFREDISQTLDLSAAIGRRSEPSNVNSAVP